MADKELNSSDVGRLLDSASPMVKMSKMLGRSKVYEAKNKLDALRSENPAMYDQQMRDAKQTREAEEDFVKDAYYRLNKKAWNTVRGLPTKTDDYVPNLKKGGKVKSKASSRGDGIAQRGKTKGRIC
jgi:hypothetical protein